MENLTLTVIDDSYSNQLSYDIEFKNVESMLKFINKSFELSDDFKFVVDKKLWINFK